MKTFKSQFKVVSITVLCLMALYVFRSIVVVKFLPFLLGGIFLLLAYYFLIRLKADPLDIRLGLIALVVMVMFTLINSLLDGVEGYIEHKYQLTENNQAISCISTGYRFNTVSECEVSGNPAAEKEANMIIRVSEWAFIAPFLLSLLLWVLGARKSKE